MMKRKILFVLMILISFVAHAQEKLKNGWWRMELIRQDGAVVPFNFEVKTATGKKSLYIRNAGERIMVDKIQFKKDSVFIEMPIFESRFFGRFSKDGSMQGVWSRATSANDYKLPFKALPGIQARFPVHRPPVQNISGRWAVNFVNPDKTEEAAVAEFQQSGNKLTGTFLTTTGDYRYLEGVVDADSLLLSTFDGSHAYFF